jgi:hypothetical protein
MSGYLFLLLVLACPLMMIFMMRGHGHGGHGQSEGHTGHGGCHGSHGAHNGRAHQREAIDDLRRQRDELDKQIAEREWEGDTSGERSPERV